MPIFAMNRGFRLSFGIPRRALLSSCARRDYNSATPVKYPARGCFQEVKVQKLAPFERYKNRETRLFTNGVSNGGREDRSRGSRGCRFPGVRGSEGGSLYKLSSSAIEPDYDIMLSDTGEDGEFEDLTGHDKYTAEFEFMEKSENTKKDKADFDNAKDNAVKVAMELLAIRSFTTVDLGKKLRSKKYPPQIVELVILELKSRGLLNDGLHAESFTQSRWLSSSWGPRRIKKALLQKGVSEQDIDKATELVFNDGDTCGYLEDPNLTISRISIDRLFAQSTKQWLRGRNASLENRRSRIVRWLQYRGFSWGITNFILKKLETSYPP